MKIKKNKMSGIKILILYLLFLVSPTVIFAIHGNKATSFEQLSSQSNIIVNGSLIKIDVTEDPYFDLLNGAGAFSNSFYQMGNIQNIKGNISGNSLLAVDHRVSHLNMSSGNQYLVFLKETTVVGLINPTNIKTYRLVEDWTGLYPLDKGSSGIETSSLIYLKEDLNVDIIESSAEFVKAIEYYVQVVLAGKHSDENEIPVDTKQMLIDLKLIPE
jgi:hypothetical protein